MSHEGEIAAIPTPERVWKKAMDEFIKKAATLIEALPYIREFEGKTVVVKYGGAAMENSHLRHSTMEDITLMKYVGMNPVIVGHQDPGLRQVHRALRHQLRSPQGRPDRVE